MNDKEITNAELLESINKGFSSIEKSFSGVDTRLSGVDTRLSGVEKSFSGVDTRLSGVEKSFSGMETKISGIDTRLSGIETSNQEILESIIRSFSKIEEKMATKDDLANLEFKITTEIQDLRLDLKSFKNDTSKLIDEQKDYTIDLNDTVMNHDKRLEKLEDKVFV